MKELMVSRSRIACLCLAPATAAGLALTAVATASAHVLQSFGPYSVAVGWLQEPAYAGGQNAVQVVVKDDKGNPVGDLSSGDLKVQIVFGTLKSDTMNLEPSFDADTGVGMQGEYDAHFTPTAPGDYTFHLTGSIHGTTADQSFTSSDKTFDTVKDPTAVEFPNKVPAPAALSTRIDRLSGRVDATTSAANSAHDSANRDLVLVIIALALGAAALSMALWTRRRAA